jgi:hypothetical protein
MIKFPKHKASMVITHNDHTTNYQSVEEYLNDYFFNRDVSEEIKKACIEAGEVWELQWYPETPIGFHVVVGPTLDSCIEQAQEVDMKLNRRFWNE